MNEKLETLLEQAREELQKMDKAEGDSLELLQGLERDIQTLLDKSEAQTPSLAEKIQAAVERFEMDYPALTDLLSKISAVLNNAGI